MTAAMELRVERLEHDVNHLANERVKPLEAQVERLETWAGPGQAATLSASLSEFREEVSGKLTELRKDFDRFAKVQDRHARAIKTLSGDVATLKTDVAQLKTDVAQLKTDVAQLKTDVAQLKTDVAQLKTDVAGLKADMVEVKGTLGQILDRLPPRQ